MTNIVAGAAILIIGLWYMARDWYLYRYIGTVTVFFFMVLLGAIAFLAGLRQPDKDRAIVTVDRRDISIDILRGLAVTTMIAANAAAYALIQPHPFLFRLYGTFAAPTFILLSGMMVAHATITKKRDMGYFITRGRLLVITAALIDMIIWNIYPFTTMDVLYLIGLSMSPAYLFQKLAGWQRWIIVCAIFLVTPLLQQLFGYTTYPTEYYLWGQPTVQVLNQTNIINHWFIDGYFPVFPWLGFSLLGVNLGMRRWGDGRESGSFATKKFFLTGAGLMMIGGIAWYLYPGSLLTRAGYSELFYPPTIGFIMSALGVIMVLFSVIDYRPLVSAYNPFRALGESALFIYILHLLIIRYCISVLWPNRSFPVFTLIYIVFSLLLISTGYTLRIVKKVWRERPLLAHFLLSG